jgi:hypothetical protein
MNDIYTDHLTKEPFELEAVLRPMLLAACSAYGCNRQERKRAKVFEQGKLPYHDDPFKMCSFHQKPRCGAVVPGNCDFKIAGDFPDKSVGMALVTALESVAREAYYESKTDFDHCWVQGLTCNQQANGVAYSLPSKIRIVRYAQYHPQEPSKQGEIELQTSCYAPTNRFCPEVVTKGLGMASNLGLDFTVLGWVSFICDLGEMLG